MSGFRTLDKKNMLEVTLLSLKAGALEKFISQVQGRKNCQGAAKGPRTPGFPVQNKYQASMFK